MFDMHAHTSFWDGGLNVVPAGFIEGESPNAERLGFVIKDLAEAEHAVDGYHEHGYPQIKIYNSLARLRRNPAHQSGTAQFSGWRQDRHAYARALLFARGEGPLVVN